MGLGWREELGCVPGGGLGQRREVRDKMGFLGGAE